MLMDCVEDTHDGIGKNVSLHTHTHVSLPQESHCRSNSLSKGAAITRIAFEPFERTSSRIHSVEANLHFFEAALN